MVNFLFGMGTSLIVQKLGPITGALLQKVRYNIRFSFREVSIITYETSKDQLVFIARFGLFLQNLVGLICIFFFDMFAVGYNFFTAIELLIYDIRKGDTNNLSHKESIFYIIWAFINLIAAIAIVLFQ